MKFLKYIFITLIDRGTISIHLSKSKWQLCPIIFQLPDSNQHQSIGGSNQLPSIHFNLTLFKIYVCHGRLHLNEKLFVCKWLTFCNACTIISVPRAHNHKFNRISIQYWLQSINKINPVRCQQEATFGGKYYAIWMIENIEKGIEFLKLLQAVIWFKFWTYRFKEQVLIYKNLCANIKAKRLR